LSIKFLENVMYVSRHTNERRVGEKFYEPCKMLVGVRMPNGL